MMPAVRVDASAPKPSRQRSFRFGVVTTSGTPESVKGWTAYARKVESLGFSVLNVADHYVNTTVCTPRLAAAAAVTSTLRVGSYVFNNDFRHPVLLAREAAELDVLSGGRMELGIGAGWVKDEYDQVGLSFEPGRVRADRFEEAIGIIRRLFASPDPIDHSGQHYHLAQCALLVAPVQAPIPLVLGGGGPRMLRIAAAHANTVAFVPQSLPGGGLDPSTFSADAFQHRVNALDEGLAALSRDDEPERAVIVMELHSSYDQIPTSGWADREVVADGPFCLVGDTEQIVDTLLERRERWGLTNITCWEEDIDAFAPVVARLAGT
jgi:probable F420-dependent oxidoreductase